MTPQDALAFLEPLVAAAHPGRAEPLLAEIRRWLRIDHERRHETRRCRACGRARETGDHRLLEGTVWNAAPSFFESWDSAALLVCPACVRDFASARDGRLPTMEMALAETRRVLDADATPEAAHAWRALERCATLAGRLEIGEVPCSCCEHPSPGTVRGGALALCVGCLTAAEHAAARD